VERGVLLIEKQNFYVNDFVGKNVKKYNKFAPL
jgi:hypothetical protein